MNIRDAVIPAVINAIINGAIAYNGFSGRDGVPLSVDSISTTEMTVWSQVVTMALSLSMVLTAITCWMMRREAPASMAAVARATVDNALFALGVLVASAIIWQRVLGTVLVSPAVAAVIVAGFAAAVTVMVQVRTVTALQQRGA
jgi:hypothetical protein